MSKSSVRGLMIIFLKQVYKTYTVRVNMNVFLLKSVVSVVLFCRVRVEHYHCKFFLLQLVREHVNRRACLHILSRRLHPISLYSRFMTQPLFTL